MFAGLTCLWYSTLAFHSFIGGGKERAAVQFLMNVINMKRRLRFKTEVRRTFFKFTNSAELTLLSPQVCGRHMSLRDVLFS